MNECLHIAGVHDNIFYTLAAHEYCIDNEDIGRSVGLFPATVTKFKTYASAGFRFFGHRSLRGLLEPMRLNVDEIEAVKNAITSDGYDLMTTAHHAGFNSLRCFVHSMVGFEEYLRDIGHPEAKKVPRFRIRCADADERAEFFAANGLSTWRNWENWQRFRQATLEAAI